MLRVCREALSSLAAEEEIFQSEVVFFRQLWGSFCSQSRVDFLPAIGFLFDIGF